MTEEFKTLETEAQVKAKAEVAKVEAGYAKLGTALKADETTLGATIKRNKWYLVAAVALVVLAIVILK